MVYPVPSPAGWARTLGVRALVSLGALAAGLLSAEAIVRLGDLGPLPRPAYSGTVLRPSAVPGLELENAPGALLVARFRDRAGRVLRDVPHRINGEGWRGREGLSAPEAALRIACVGDSQIFGLGVGEEETFPRALEQALRWITPELEVRALNFGVCGYQAAEKACLVEAALAPYRPALVLMELYIWESPDGQQRLAVLQARNRLTRWLRPGAPGWSTWLRERSRCVDFVASGIFRRAWLDNWMRAHGQAVAAEGPGFEETCAQILRAREAAAGLGARFALVLYPMLFEERGQLVSAHLGRSLGAFAERHGLAFLDLHPAFTGRDLEPLRVHPDDYHLSGAGHAVAAEHTAAFLARTGLLTAATN